MKIFSIINLALCSTVILTISPAQSQIPKAADAKEAGRQNNPNQAIESMLQQRRTLRAQNPQKNAAFNPQRQNFRKEMLQRFDTNHDGLIDEKERKQMQAERHSHRTEGAIAAPGSEAKSSSTPQKSISPEATNSSNSTTTNKQQ